MRGNFESAAVAEPSVRYDPQAVALAGRIHWTRWGSAAALLIAIAALLLGSREIEHVAQIERLAVKIEKARTLAPETKDVVDRLVARPTPASLSDGSAQALRRKAAIERIMAAVSAKDISSTGSGGAVRQVNLPAAGAH